MTDPAGNVLSQTDGLGNVTAFGYNSVGEQVSTAQGQIAPYADGARFPNLPQTPGVPRIFTVYDQTASAPDDPGNYWVSESGSACAAIQFNITSATPLGSGWYELGTVTLAAR